MYVLLRNANLKLNSDHSTRIWQKAISEAQGAFFYFSAGKVTPGTSSSSASHFYDLFSFDRSHIAHCYLEPPSLLTFASPKGSLTLWVFFLEDKISAPDVFSSCFFIPWTDFETSLVMVSCYGYEI